MDGRNYLKQISAEARPAPKSRKGLLKSPFFIVGLVGVLLIMLVIIIGSSIGDGAESLDTQSVRLKFHIDGTLAVITEYQPNVKSSALRSSSASLASVLSNTSRDLTSYLTNTYGYDSNKDDSKKYATVAEDSKLAQDALESDLFEAKITGVLDRVYAMKMAYEITQLAAEESTLYNETKDENLQTIITTSYNSLENLYDKFNDFSGAK